MKVLPLRSPATTATLISRQWRRICGNLPIRLELMISATTLQAAASTQFPPAAAIPTHSTIQCPCRGIHHIQAPSPLAQASVGVLSLCGKNEQENFRFLWNWQPRRPPASLSAAGRRAPSHHSSFHRASAPRAQQTPSPHPIHPPLS